MSLVQPQQPPERRPPPPPPINAPTNNPFRRGPNSPALNPQNRTESPSQRPVSTNPFLDNPFDMPPPTSQRPESPAKSHGRRPPSRPGDNEARLRDLSLEERPQRRGLPPRRGHHHPSNSTEIGNRGEAIDTLDIFADPPRRPTERRTRRNSESSVAEHKTMDDEERRKERERRHRDRPKDSQGRPIPSRSKKPGRRLDIIDKLDVTSIYGTGMFHHDGPFDALNPHRNRQNSKRAPMQAFPKDSMNNVLGGSGPVNKNIDLNRFHGYQEDSFKDFNNVPAKKGGGSQTYESYIGPGVRPRGSSKGGGPMIEHGIGFNATAKVEPVHGDESLGLGTSTFFEGTPAPRTAIQRRDSENEVIGLARKKSIAQKIRGISNNRPRRFEGGGGSGDFGSPEGRQEARTTSPDALSTGNSNGMPRIHERNPFFQDYDQEYEKKGASIRVAEQQKAAAESGGRVDDGSRPVVLTRSVTEGDAIPSGAAGGNSVNAASVDDKSGGGNGGGFLNRVKSLRGGGRGKARA